MPNRQIECRAKNEKDSQKMGEGLAMLGIGALVIVGVFAWQRRQRAMRYDLRYWNEEPPGAPYDDVIEDDNASGPYCHRCDHPNPPDTHFCQSCGQKIG